MIQALALLALLAVPGQALAGLCITQGNTLSCTDAGETIILKGDESVVYSGLAGRPMTVTRDAQGNLLGMIGEQKLIVQKLDGVLVARFGNRKLACTQAGPGITLCK